MRVGILGTGNVGQTLAAGFAKKGHEVVLGTRDPEATLARTETTAWGPPPVSEFLSNHPGVRLGTFVEAAKHGEVLVLAVEGTHAVDVVRAAGPDDLAGKLVLDTSNALDHGPNGVHLAGNVPDSVLQQVQKAAPKAHVVKAWNCTPGGVMVDPDLPGGPGTQFVCGDDAEAKEKAIGILRDFGWEAIDVGDATVAPYLEGMGLTVINHGVRSGSWTWGLKLLRA